MEEGCWFLARATIEGGGRAPSEACNLAIRDLWRVLGAGKLLTVVALVLANGFFVAAEFSLVAIRHTRVKQLIEEGHPLASAVQRALDSLDTYLAATQLGITMSSIALGWIGEPILAQGIETDFLLPPSRLGAGQRP